MCFSVSSVWHCLGQYVGIIRIFLCAIVLCCDKRKICKTELLGSDGGSTKVQLSTVYISSENVEEIFFFYLHTHTYRRGDFLCT